jgi:hypothetical protein
VCDGGKRKADSEREKTKPDVPSDVRGRGKRGRIHKIEKTNKKQKQKQEDKRRRRKSLKKRRRRNKANGKEKKERASEAGSDLTMYSSGRSFGVVRPFSFVCNLSLLTIALEVVGKKNKQRGERKRGWVEKNEKKERLRGKKRDGENNYIKKDTKERASD